MTLAPARSLAGKGKDLVLLTARRDEVCHPRTASTQLCRRVLPRAARTSAKANSVGSTSLACQTQIIGARAAVPLQPEDQHSPLLHLQLSRMVGTDVDGRWMWQDPALPVILVGGPR